MFTVFASRAMAAMIGFRTLPGSKVSVRARFLKKFGSVEAVWFGSNSGRETMARMAPDFGSATIVTADSAWYSRNCFSSSVRANCWMVASRVSIIPKPSFTEGLNFFGRIGLLKASAKKTFFPAEPARAFSYCSSMPARPRLSRLVKPTTCAARGPVG